MELQQKHWKRDADRLWAASPFDVREAAALAAEIARHGADETTAAGGGAGAAEPARRVLEDIGPDEPEHRTAALRRHPRRAACAGRAGFGKRAAVPAPEQQHRLLLGLPAERHLSDPEIQQGYKRAAKRLHPDAGGSAREFAELSAARDALMKRR